MRSRVSFGDLLRALVALQPGDRAALRELRHVFSTADLDWRRLADEDAARPQPRPRTKPASPPAVPPKRPLGVPFEIAIRALEVAEEDDDEPVWLSASDLPEDLRAPSAHMPLAPLFTPRWTRGIATAALSSHAEEGPPDVDRIVALVARGEPVRRIPRERVPTLRRGVRILCDVSDAMLPFAADQQAFVASLAGIVGAHRLDVVSFARTPPGDAGYEGTRWEPPAAGTPILVLSDLGLGAAPAFADRATTAQWLDFAVRTRRARCPVIALMPYPRARWNRALARVMALVEWDRVTTAAATQHALHAFWRVVRG